MFNHCKFQKSVEIRIQNQEQSWNDFSIYINHSLPHKKNTHYS